MDLKKLNTKFDEIAKVAGYLWQKGWAEQNAGNISINVTGEVAVNKNALGLFDFVEMEIPFAELDGCAFMVSATGARFREIAEDPKSGVLIVMVSIDSGGYYIISHDDVQIRPTSEFISHLAMQAYFIREGKGRRAILHTHPPEIITMTHLPKIDNTENINEILWQMHTELPVFLADGVGFAPFEVPGSRELADISMKLLEKHRVILWEKHGALATAESLVQCFDLLDIAEKAAAIYLKAKSNGTEPTGLTKEQIKQIQDFWGV